MIQHQEKISENKTQEPASKINEGNRSIQLKDNREPSIVQQKLAEKTATKESSFIPIQKKANTTGLPDTLKSGIENLSGHSMDDVKVHYNSAQPAQLNAHAYAQGTDIHIASGQEKHLPHEAWHVVQQKQGRVKPTLQMKGKVNVNDDKSLENEADIMGAKAILQCKVSSEKIITQKLNDHLPIQRVIVTIDEEKVNITNDMDAGEIIAALGYKASPSKFANGTFSKKLSLSDKRLIRKELESHPKSSEDLKSLINDIDDEESDEESDHNSDFSDDDSTFAEMSIGGMSLLKPKINKVELARRIIDCLRNTGGFPVFLSGGGAVTLAGGPRNINDLDLRIDLAEGRTFSVSDILSQGLIDAINRILKENFEDVEPLDRSDPESGMTIDGRVNGVEVSITRTPAVQYLSIGTDKNGIVRLGEFDLIIDKAYSFTMRRKGDFKKKATDLIDMLSLIKKQPGLVHVLKGLVKLRGEAYSNQSGKANSRVSEDIYDADLLVEFHESLIGIINERSSDKELKKIMTEFGTMDLYPLINTVIKATENYLDNPPDVTVI